MLEQTSVSEQTCIKLFYRKFEAIQYNGNNFEDIKLFIANNDKFHVDLFKFYYEYNPYYEYIPNKENPDSTRDEDWERREVGKYLENISTLRHAILYVDDWLYFDVDNRITTNCSEVMNEFYSQFNDVELHTISASTSDLTVNSDLMVNSGLAVNFDSGLTIKPNSI